MSKPLPQTARIVIIGGGIIGCSIAYHLAKYGAEDVVLLERKQLTCGTTWHAAGLLTTLRHSENATKLAKYTLDLFKTLEEETGQATGVLNTGSIQIASDEVRLEEMRRGCAMADCFGVKNHEITPDQIAEHWPLANISDMMAGFYFPDDARTNPTDTTMALAKGARAGGVQIFENISVSNIVEKDGEIVGVETEQGRINTNIIVNCTGMWARDFGAQSNVNIPLHAAEHYYLITESMDGMHPDLPILRDPGNAAYYREETGKLMLGLFEPLAAAWGEDGIKSDFSFDELPPDWDRMLPYIEKAMARVPSMENAGIKLLFCGPESFTPDHNALMGEAPNIKNYFVAAGFNSLGILSSGGAGMIMANWIMNGHPPMDVFDTDLRRAHDFQRNPKFLKDRVTESLGLGYQYHWPFRQYESARNVKKLVLHDRLVKAGGCFGESAGWERPNWYAPEGVEPKYKYSYKRQNWFEYNAAEHQSVRENVGVFEQSSFSKFLVQGRDAEKSLNWICTNNIAVPVGKSVYTQFLNVRGGIEADLTITRTAEDAFLVLTAPFTHNHVFHWIKGNISDKDHSVITDITGAYGMLNVQGPNARALLATLTDADLSNDAFPFGTMQDIDIGYQTVKALRITYMGELGWELYIPTEYLASVYDALIEKGKAFDLRHCGYHTLASLRIEKAYREWAHDIGADDTPLEAGLGFAADLNKPGGFLGREALMEQKQRKPLTKRLVQFLLEDPEPLLYHDEPILVDGEINSITTSAMYGHTLGGAVAMGYLNNADGVTADWIAERQIEIRIGVDKFAAKASLKPMYDPKSERIKA
ncbi:MAG: FAD-dependent oxidoreductase [Pseudomonadota bacterium]